MSAKHSRDVTKDNFFVTDGYAITDGTRHMGMIRPHGRGFEAFVLIGDQLEYLAKADSRSDAIRLIREASR